MDGSASKVNMSTRGRKRGRTKGTNAWTDMEKTLVSDAPGRAVRLRDGRGERRQRVEQKQPKAGLALTLVSVGEGLGPLETRATQPPKGDTEAQIENYPSSGEALTPVARTTRRIKKLVDFTEEVQGVSRRTRSMSAKAPPADHTHTHPEVQLPPDHTHTHRVAGCTIDNWSHNSNSTNRMPPLSRSFFRGEGTETQNRSLWLPTEPFGASSATERVCV